MKERLKKVVKDTSRVKCIDYAGRNLGIIMEMKILKEEKENCEIEFDYIPFLTKEEKELQQRLDLATEIYKLAMKINTENDKHSVIFTFYSFFITVSIYKNEECVLNIDVNFNSKYYPHQDMMSKLQEVKSELEGYCGSDN